MSRADTDRAVAIAQRVVHEVIIKRLPQGALADAPHQRRRPLGLLHGRVGGMGDTVVEQIYRNIRAFRIYDGPPEVHTWSLAKKVKRDWQGSLA